MGDSVPNSSFPGCFKQPEMGNFVMGIVLGIAAVLSFLPQVKAIFTMRSSAGISPIALALGLFATVFIMINHIILNYPNFACCPQLPFAQCIMNNVAFIPIAGPPIGTVLVFIFLIIFYPTQPTKEQSYSQGKLRQLLTLFLFLGILFAGCLVALVAAILSFAGQIDTPGLSIYAKACGLAAAIGVLIHWSPQIYKTWVLKSPRALSLVTLCLQVPGALIFLIFQLVNNADWTTVVPYSLSAAQQSILIVLVSIFTYREWKAKKLEKAEIEQRPLVNEEYTSTDATSDGPKSINHSASEDSRFLTSPSSVDSVSN